MSYKKYIAIPLEQLEFVRGEEPKQEVKIEEKIEEKKEQPSRQEPEIKSEEKQEVNQIVKKRKRRGPPGIRAKKWIQF